MSISGDIPGLGAPTAEEWRADSPEFLRVVWRDRGHHPLLVREVVGAVWSVNLLYDFTLLLLHPHYREVSLAEAAEAGPEFWREVEPNHWLEVVALEHRSPLFIVSAIPALVAGASAIWALTQTFEKIANFRLKRRLLRANVAKAEAEARISKANARRYEYELQRRDALQSAAELRRRFEESPLEIVEGELLDDNPAA